MCAFERRARVHADGRSVGVRIGGWHATSLVDYPGGICSVVFFSGCNLRCPYCHNPSLALGGADLPRYSAQSILGLVQGLAEKRKGLVDGICVSGGEPTIQDGIDAFLRVVKSFGLKVKLDTNGTRPRVLRALLEQGLVDYVAMDIKAPPDKYALVCRAEVDISDIEESIEIIAGCGVEYEFRTTAASTLLDEPDFIRIGCWLRGARLYVLQPCRPGVHLDPRFECGGPDQLKWLNTIRRALEPYFGSVKVRGAS